MAAFSGFAAAAAAAFQCSVWGDYFVRLMVHLTDRPAVVVVEDDSVTDHLLLLLLFHLSVTVNVFCCRARSERADNEMCES